jgi:hypothetical protein
LQNTFHVRRRVVDGEAFPDEGIGTAIGVDLVSPCNKRTMDGSDVAPIHKSKHIDYTKNENKSNLE